MVGKLSLTELQLIIKDSLYLALPDMYWVTAEISEIRENYAGHCYLELIEKHQDEKNIRARVKAVIWSKRFGFLKSYFENITGESLKEGLKILVKVKIEYHEVYGLSLVISDIDPSFTLGEMALKRQLIIKKLEDEGVLAMNRDLDFPLLPQRVAVVSSKNAAGYEDFINHLTGNIHGYTFYTALFETAMQGTDTETSIINALDKIASRTSFFDVAVIIRGGGSQTDLSWFDNYNIAFHITQFPIPVITGIGHEKDLSVTDMVAFKSLKTPTAVADFLVECVNDTENHLIDLSTAISENTRSIIEHYNRIIETCKMKLIPVARIMISDIKEQLSGQIIKMINTGKEFIGRAGKTPADQRSRLQSVANAFVSGNKTHLEQINQNLKIFTTSIIIGSNTRISGFDKTLKILNPDYVLGRGYTITSLNGKILKKCDILRKNDLIDTKFSDGSVKSRVEVKKGRSK